MVLVKNNILKGIGASQGWGIGKAVIINNSVSDYSSVCYTTAENEKAKLQHAIEKFTRENEALAENLKKSAGEKESEILTGHNVMLSDPFMLSQMHEQIDSGETTEYAVDTVCTKYYDMFANTGDALMQQRASDVQDIKNRLIGILLGEQAVDIGSVEKNSVLIAEDFTPSMTSRINKENVAAIITEVGGVTSHSAILARAIGIPAVLSVSHAVSKITQGQLVIADGFDGTVILDPEEDEVQKYAEKQTAFLKEKQSLNEYAGKKTQTKSGAAKKVFANIAKAEDVQNAIQNDAEGIGLFRTEFLFMDRNHEPTEQEQFEAYSAVAKAMDDKEVIIRTLDIGGDKAIDYLSIEREDNPFLGHRAIRYCLDNPVLFKTQIRAILRAAYYGNIKIMLPLISDIREITQAKRLIDECVRALEKDGIKHKTVPVGIMIETPSAALISDLLAKESDFFSIGTNDLTAYIMAVDRGNSKVAQLYSTKKEAVMRAVEMTIKNAKKAGIEVGMCGEAAGDAHLIPQFVQWGLDEFSVSPAAVLQTRKCICNCL